MTDKENINYKKKYLYYKEKYIKEKKKNIFLYNRRQIKKNRIINNDDEKDSVYSESELINNNIENINDLTCDELMEEYNKLCNNINNIHINNNLNESDEYINIFNIDNINCKVLEKGNNKKPNIDNTVLIEYILYSIDGEMYDNSFKNLEPLKIKISKSVNAFKKILPYMDEKSNWKITFPSEYNNDNDFILNKNEKIVYDLKLLKIL